MEIMNTLKHHLSSKITSSVCVLLASVAAFHSPRAFAQNATDTWVGNASAKLSDPNWSGNNPPIAGDNWVFGSAGTAGSVLDNSFAGGITASNILFSPGASAYTFFDNPITVARSLSNSSTALQTFNNNITLSSGATIGLNAGGGDILLNGTLTASAPFTITAGGILTLTNANTGIAGANSAITN